MGFRIRCLTVFSQRYDTTLRLFLGCIDTSLFGMCMPKQVYGATLPADPQHVLDTAVRLTALMHQFVSLLNVMGGVLVLGCVNMRRGVVGCDGSSSFTTSTPLVSSRGYSCISVSLPQHCHVDYFDTPGSISTSQSLSLLSLTLV